MALQKRTIVGIIITLLIIGGLLGLVLGLSLSPSNDDVELEIWPSPSDGTKEPLIVYKQNDKASFLPWITRIDQLINEYRSRSGSGEAHGAENLMACDFNAGPAGDNVCEVPVHHYHPCTASNQYNYHRAAPCIFLKLNKVLNWTPAPYNTTQDLPEDLPADLKQHIALQAGRPEANTVWVSCEGETPSDVEHIGPVQYIPWRGFPAYYYPFTNKKNYLSPLVAVLFERPMRGIVIGIRCRAWAKNIQYDQYERRGSVHFDLMID